MEPSKDPSQIPSDVSPLRFMIAEAEGVPHVRFDTLESAKANPDAVVIMEGDYGGQIYLTCPVRLVRCTQAVLEQLLNDIDDYRWCDPSGAGLYFELGRTGTRVAGGMGGGAIIDGVWLHELLKHLRPQVEAVIDGRLDKIEPAVDEESD